MGRGTTNRAGRFTLFDRVTLGAMILAFLVLFFATISDFGINFDAALGELYLGQKYASFWASGGREAIDLNRDDVASVHRADHPDWFTYSHFARENAEHVWGFGPMLSAVSKSVFWEWTGWLDPVDAHHAFLGPLVALQAWALAAFARRRWGSSAAVAAVAVLLVYPRQWAHAHNNTKDVPESVLFTLAILAFHEGIVRGSGWRVIAAGALAGLALATKANAAFLVLILLPWWLVHLRRRDPEGARVPVIAWACLPFVTATFFFAGWPLMVSDFPGALSRHLDFLTSYGAQGEPHWRIEPLRKLVLVTPIPVLGLAVAGIVRLARRAPRDSVAILLLLWLAVPVLRVSAPRAYDYDGIRHFLEVVPALALVAGVGLEALLDGAARVLARGSAARARWLAARRSPVGVALLALLLCPITIWNVRNHPYQLVFYNAFAGGLGGAQARGMPEAADYWGSSYRQGMNWLNEHAEPGAVVFVGVAQHIVFAHETWLRDDLQLLRMGHFEPALADARRHGVPVYLLALANRGGHDELSRYEGVVAPIHEVTVDGGAVFRIWRIAG